MTKHRQIVYGAQLPQSWLDAIQELLGTFLSPNASLTLLSTTTVQIVAGTDNNQVGVCINGRWRYITANVNATHPGGVAATYNLWATASTDNSFTLGPPEVDNTVYGFSIQILPIGSTPGTVLSRIIGTVVWSGTVITDCYLINDFPTDGLVNVGSLRTLGAGALQAAPGNAPSSAVAAIPVDGATGTPSLRTIGTGAQQASPGTEAASRATAITSITPLIGVFSSRPSAASVVSGKVYFASDTGVAYISDGSVWWRLDADSAAKIAALSTVNAFKVSRATPAAVVNGASSSVSWDTPVYALGDCASIGSGPDFIIPTTGLYAYDMMIAISSASSKTNLPAGFGVVKAVSHMDDDNHALNYTGGNLDQMQVHGDMQCTAGDHVRVQGYCTGAADVTWGGYFSMRRIQG